MNQIKRNQNLETKLRVTLIYKTKIVFWFTLKLQV